MPANKKSSIDSKFANERIPVMDYLLRGGKVVDTREKFIKLLKRHNPKGVSISESTFDKDLRVLREMVKEKSNGKVELLFNKNDGYSYSDTTFSVFPEIVVEEEHYLLQTAANMMQVFRGTSMEANCVDIFDRIILTMPGYKKQFKEEREHFIQMSNKSQASTGKWVERILKAILMKECLEMQYKNSRGEQSKKIISPYALKHYLGKWYFVAHDQLCNREDKTNVYSIEGVQKLGISNKSYFTDDFQVDYYFKYCLGVWHQHQKEPIEVQLSFSASRKDYILANPLHPTQVADFDTKSNELNVVITVYNTPELELMLLGFGNTVKVQSPQFLVDRMKELLKKALERYE